MRLLCRVTTNKSANLFTRIRRGRMCMHALPSTFHDPSVSQTRLCLRYFNGEVPSFSAGNSKSIEILLVILPCCLNSFKKTDIELHACEQRIRSLAITISLLRSILWTVTCMEHYAVISKHLVFQPWSTSKIVFFSYSFYRLGLSYGQPRRCP
jgi:hypothetical protein